MKWLKPNLNTDDVEVGGDGGGGKKFGKIGGIGALVIIVISLILGKNPLQMLSFVDNAISGSPQQTSSGTAGTIENTGADNDSTVALKVFNSANDVWTDIFQKQFHKHYPHPRLYIFNNSTQTACGGASAATGPFYCPADRKVYIDLAFFNELATRFKAPGELAQCYVVAHEVGHHIQNLLGVTDKLDAQRGQISEAAYNKLSVKLELQADFYAGLWAHYAEKEGLISIDPNDISDALAAADAVGDDNLQKQAQGYAVPESFTHGTSAERMYWFKKGYASGDITEGDTFDDPSLN